MLSLKATIRDKKAKPDALRKKGFLPAVLYGEGIKNILLQVPERDFLKVFNQAGETSLVSLEFDSKKTDVLIHQVAKNSVSGRFLHIDFFHPSSKKKIEAEIPLVFEGESEAVKDLGGVLVKEIQELHVRGLAKDLPKEVKVNISLLKGFEDRIMVKDLVLPGGVEVIGHHAEDFEAHAVLPKEEKIEEPQPSQAEAVGEASAEEKEEKEDKKEKEEK